MQSYDPMFLRSLLLSVSLVALVASAAHARPVVKFHADAVGLVTSVEVEGLPALSEDGRTLLAVGSSEDASDLVSVDCLQATLWGGMRKQYLSDSYMGEDLEQHFADGKYLQKMIRRRKLRSISMQRVGRDGWVRNGKFAVHVSFGRLQFTVDGKQVYSRKITPRYGRGANLMSEEGVDSLKVEFVGAYIDPVHRVFVVSFGSGECDCACDLAPFYQHYRWDESGL